MSSFSFGNGRGGSGLDRQVSTIVLFRGLSVMCFSINTQHVPLKQNSG